MHSASLPRISAWRSDALVSCEARQPGEGTVCNAPPLANVKHADDYTIEDLNADVQVFRLAFVQYMRARRSAEASRLDLEDDYVVRKQPTTSDN
jgi:hypothetical protein